MPPKFQSSFIPKGPLSGAGVPIPGFKRGRNFDLLSFGARLALTLSVLLALGVVGYRLYLGYSIKKMGRELESIRETLANGEIGELIALNNRIVSTEALIDEHRALSPLFVFLEASTPKSVSFTDFQYSLGEDGPELSLRGEATSYSALASEAQAIYKNKDLREPVFSDIRLDSEGHVSFYLKILVSPDLLSYKKVANTLSLPRTATTSIQIRTATSTASTTSPNRQASSTPN